MTLVFYSGLLVFGILTYIAATEISLTLESPVIRNEGEEVNVTCSSPCSGHCSVSWRKDENPPRTVGNDGTLHIKSLKVTDHGTYTCTANSGSSATNKSLQILVNYPPTKAELLINGTSVSNPLNTVNEGDSVGMTCVVDGNPPPDVKWHKNGVNIKTDHLQKKYGHQHNNPYNSSHIIQEAKCEDQGKYICQAGNSINDEDPVESILKLKVKCSLKLLNGSGLSQNLTAEIGENLILRLTVLSSPSLKLVGWYLQTENRSRDIKNDSLNFNHNISISENVHTITLAHYNVTENSSGLYWLFIGNELKYLKLNYSIWIHYNETDNTNENNTYMTTTAPRLNSTSGVKLTGYLPYVFGVTCSAVVLIVIFALAFRGPMNICVEGCVSLLSCNCSPSGKQRLWVTIPSNERIYNEMNSTHLCNSDRLIDDGGFTLEPLCPSNSFRDININAKDYRDSSMV